MLLPMRWLHAAVVACQGDEQPAAARGVESETSHHHIIDAHRERPKIGKQNFLLDVDKCKTGGVWF
jgi:hypothetical protein